MIKTMLENMPLTPQEQVIAQYITQHPDYILHHQAKELSAKIQVSAPTIIRFVKKLGFQGYHAFQLAYMQEYLLDTQRPISPLLSTSSIQDIIQILPQIYEQVFFRTQQALKTEAFVRTINYMIQAKRIDFYANDNNFAEIQSACLKLTTLGYRAQAFNTINQVYVDALNPAEVVAFVVSHTGKNQTMVDAAYYLRKKRIRVVAITSHEDPTLALICNESLYIDMPIYPYTGHILLYGIAIHYIIDVLITALSLRKPQS